MLLIAPEVDDQTDEEVFDDPETANPVFGDVPENVEVIASNSEDDTPLTQLLLTVKMICPCQRLLISNFKSVSIGRKLCQFMKIYPLTVSFI